MKLESFKSRREFLRLGCRALSTAGAARHSIGPV